MEKDIKNEMFTNYKDMVVFQNKRYAVIANGAELWYCSTIDDSDSGMKIKLEDGDTFPGSIVSLSYLDMNYYSPDLYTNGHLGVAFDNGEFRIYEVIEHKTGGIVNEVTLKKLYLMKFQIRKEIINLVLLLMQYTNLEIALKLHSCK